MHCFNHQNSSSAVGITHPGSGALGILQDKSLCSSGHMESERALHNLIFLPYCGFFFLSRYKMKVRSLQGMYKGNLSILLFACEVSVSALMELDGQRIKNC